MPTPTALPSNRIFVYGTLRRGFDPHAYLASSARFLGSGKIGGRLYGLGEFPGAVPSVRPGEAITGELYELLDPHPQLAKLDEYEEFDPACPEESLFVRRLAEVWLGDGNRTRAWTYFLSKEPSDALRIPGGDYLSFQRTQLAGTPRSGR